MNMKRDSLRFNPLKWLLLDHSGANIELGVLYGVARQRYPEASEDEIDRSFGEALLDLCDEGLVALFRAGRPDGYNLELNEVEHLTREEIARELETLVGGAEPSELVWVRETKRGADVFKALPPETVAEVRGTADS